MFKIHTPDGLSVTVRGVRAKGRLNIGMAEIEEANRILDAGEGGASLDEALAVLSSGLDLRGLGEALLSNAGSSEALRASELPGEQTDLDTKEKK